MTTLPRRFRHRFTYANVAATLALFLVVSGGSAYAATQLAPNSVGSAQLKKGSVTKAKLAKGFTVTGATGAKGDAGAAGAVGAKGEVGATGATGETGAVGATGAKGDTGVTGTKGDTGTAGSPGLAGLEVVSATTAEDSISYKQAVATCPVGKKAISGGSTYAASAAPAPLAVAESGPTVSGSRAPDGATPDGWIVAMNEESTFAGTWILTVKVVCATVAP